VTLLPPYALLAVAVVVDVALQIEGRPISAKTLAIRQGVAPRSLEATLRSLVHARILESTRGPHGGYRLAPNASAVTLSDILRAVGSDDDGEESQSEILINIVLPVLAPAVRAFYDAQNQINLDDLVRYADRVGIK
jgi:Rrf2 family iron-sulfur cluster assembly transcriptional regulator